MKSTLSTIRWMQGVSLRSANAPDGRNFTQRGRINSRNCHHKQEQPMHADHQRQKGACRQLRTREDVPFYRGVEISLRHMAMVTKSAGRMLPCRFPRETSIECGSSGERNYALRGLKQTAAPSGNQMSERHVMESTPTRVASASIGSNTQMQTLRQQRKRTRDCSTLLNRSH